MLFLTIIFDYSSQNFSWAFPIKILYLCTHCISFIAVSCLVLTQVGGRGPIDEAESLGTNFLRAQVSLRRATMTFTIAWFQTEGKERVHYDIISTIPA